MPIDFVLAVLVCPEVSAPRFSDRVLLSGEFRRRNRFRSLEFLHVTLDYQHLMLVCRNRRSYHLLGHSCGFVSHVFAAPEAVVRTPV